MIENNNPDKIKMFAAELRKRMPFLDLHGFFPDEVETRVDQFLYDSYNGNAESARIVYGIGEGKMREKVLSFLEHHPLKTGIIEEIGSCVVVLG